MIIENKPVYFNTKYLGDKEFEITGSEYGPNFRTKNNTGTTVGYGAVSFRKTSTTENKPANPAPAPAQPQQTPATPSAPARTCQMMDSQLDITGVIQHKRV